jgi:hypothetical protein
MLSAPATLSVARWASSVALHANAKSAMGVSRDLKRTAHLRKR